MKNPEVNFPPEENRLDQLKEVIRNAPQRIEAEFARTANPWTSCYGSSIFQIETYLGSPKLASMISPEKLKELEEKVQSIKEELHVLKEQYPDKNPSPPNETKERLLQQLDIFKD